VFRGCKVAREGEQTFVRIYSHRVGSEKLTPTPYEVSRFDGARGILTKPSEEEAARYSIPNYK